MYVDLPAAEVTGRVTSYVRTVMDCAARLPFDEALAIADSALRAGDVTRTELLEAADQMPNRYRARCRRVAQEADGRAANPFESVLRAIALEIRGLCVQPQVAAGVRARGLGWRGPAAVRVATFGDAGCGLMGVRTGT